MAYVAIPSEYNLSTEFPTWIIAYCLDTNSWFCTNQRFFYYEYSKEFKSEKSAIEYFRNNIPEFFALNCKLGFRKNSDMFLENTRERWSQNIDSPNTVGLKKMCIEK